PALGELFAAGAKPEELTAIASTKGERMIDVANFFTSVSRLDQALRVLDQAEAAGAAPDEVLVTRATFALQTGDNPEAALAKARARGIRDPRLALVDAELRLRAKDEHAADAALAVLDAAAAQFPGDLEIERKRMNVVINCGKWHAASRAVEGLKAALFQNQRGISEAHAAEARIAAKLGRCNEALGEYRILLGEEPRNVQFWLEYGRVAESAGRPL